MSIYQLVHQIQTAKKWDDTRTLGNLLEVIAQWDEERVLSTNDVNDMLLKLKTMPAASVRGPKARKDSQ